MSTSPPRTPTPPATTTSSPATSATWRTCWTSTPSGTPACTSAPTRSAARRWPTGRAIAERLRLDLTVLNKAVDPQWSFMTLDWDGKIRMDCSSPNVMASVVAKAGDYDIATGNDADADRHGIVTPDAGLMNPNHYLAVAIDYLYSHRSEWARRHGGRQDPGVVVDDRPGGRASWAAGWSRCRSGSSGSCPA